MAYEAVASPNGRQRGVNMSQSKHILCVSVVGGEEGSEKETARCSGNSRTHHSS